MNKNFLYLFTAILLISFASAGLGTFQQDTCVEIRTILNQSSVNISSIGLPNNTITYLNDAMTKNGQTFNYTFCNTNPLGTYVYDYFDADGNVYVNDFKITYNGDDLTEGKATLFSILLFVLVGFWFLVLFYITKLPSKNVRDEGGLIQISKLKYLRDALWGFLWGLSVSILFLASNIALAYLPGQMFGAFLFKMFQLMGWMSLPLIVVWFLWMFHQAVTDKEIIRFMERGADYGGKGAL